jgi:hypothetical protein
MRYFTNASTTGKVRSGQFAFAIGVLESSNNHMPIGMAFQVRWTDEGLAVWALQVHGANVPGQWIIIDGEFVQLGEVAE